MASNPFLMNVADLLGRDPSSRPVSIEEPVEWRIDTIRILADPPLLASLILHPVSGGVAITGKAYFATAESCYRCLTETTTDREVTIGALFDDSKEDEETYPLDGHDIDVAQMLRDEVLLSLPLTPVCGETCPGVVSSAQTELNTGSSDSDQAERSPFAVLKDLLEPDDQSE